MRPLMLAFAVASLTFHAPALAAPPRPGFAPWERAGAGEPRASRPETRSERVARLERDRRELRAAVAAARSQAGGGGQALEARIAELEARIRGLEAELSRLKAEAVKAVPGTQTPADPPGMTPADLAGQGGQVTAGNAFNPSITVIPDVVYYNDDRQGAAGEIAAEAPGFGAHGGGDGHAHGEAERGFNLRELEVTFSGSVDPYVEAWATLAVGGGEVEAEEAYVQTRKFLPGLQLRAGKFYSGVGYLNRQHPHQWDFVDRPLAYDLLLGGALNEVGVQATWLPELPVYALFGFEALQGENQALANHLGPEDSAFFGDRAGPRLFTGFVKVSPDIGYAGALQVGASLGHSRLHQERHDGETEAEAFEGRATFFGLDAVYRYDSGKPRGVGDLSLQAEYFRRSKDLRLVGLDGAAVSGPTLDPVQDAVYLQAVYGFAERWTAGFRVDVAGLTNRSADGGEDLGASRRYTANFTFNPTEFSRLRFQYERGDFAAAAGRERYHQAWVQLQVSLGTHGSHTF